MFERFTERARQVVVLAQEEARGLHHGEIRTEHILLGLLREEEGLGARVLSQLGFDAEAIREAQRPGDSQSGSQIPFTPTAKKALESSLREALSIGHTYIGTEHVLLGLITSPGDSSSFLQDKLGDDWEDVIRTATLRSLRIPPKPSELSSAQKDKLELQDTLNDLITGIKTWHANKVDSGEWTEADEALARWIEGGKASYLLRL